MFLGSMWLSSKHMFGSDNFWDKSPSWYLKILKFQYFKNFKIFENALGQFILKSPSQKCDY